MKIVRADLKTYQVRFRKEFARVYGFSFKLNALMVKNAIVTDLPCKEEIVRQYENRIRIIKSILDSKVK